MSRVEARGGLVDLEFALDKRLVDDSGFFCLVCPEMEADLVARFLGSRVKGLPGIVKRTGSAQVEGEKGQLDYGAAGQFTGHHLEEGIERREAVCLGKPRAALGHVLDQVLRIPGFIMDGMHDEMFFHRWQIVRGGIYFKDGTPRVADSSITAR